MAPKPQPLSFSSVPQATITHFPEKHLKHVQNALQTSSDNISSCVVGRSVNTDKLFGAVLEYAALCPNVLDPDASHSFFVDSNDPFGDGPDPSIVWAEEDSIDQRKAEQRLEYILPEARRGNIPKPNLRMDIGATLVRWPPPKHLVPEYLLSRGNRDPYKLPESVGNVIELHIMHYEMGAPQKRYDGITTLHLVRVSTCDGDESLKAFLFGVMQWNFDRTNPDHMGQMYNLYRFKTNSCESGGWSPQGARRARPLQSVILEDGQMEALSKDIESFLHPKSKRFYIEHGLPYRRSYLFEGPLGTGKSSTIRALAGKYSIPCYFLSMTNEQFSNQTLLDALAAVPSYSFLILEDVDSLFKSDRSSATKAAVTFSGLLNALDGITSTEGLVTILTTNHVERLDPALIRGGRVDRKFYFAPPSETQMRKLFLMYYKDAEDDVVNAFSQKVSSWKGGSMALTIATLQQLFIRNREMSAEECVEDVDKVLKEYEPVRREPLTHKGITSSENH